MPCIVTNAAFAAPTFLEDFYEEVLNHLAAKVDADSALVNGMNALSVAHAAKDDVEEAIHIEPKWHRSLTDAIYALCGDYPSEDCFEQAELFGYGSLKTAANKICVLSSYAELMEARTALERHRNGKSCKFCSK